MTKLTDSIKNAITKQEDSQKTQKVQEVESNAVPSQQISLEPPRQEEVTFADYKEKWEQRRVVDLIQPYASQIELFLGLIEPSFNLEIQDAIALNAINNAPQEVFVVKDSKVKFHWQLTDDRGDVFNGAKVHNPFAIKALYGALDQQFEFIYKKNLKGSNPCIAINYLEGAGRLNENTKAIRAIWLEDDEVRSKPRTAIDSDNPLPLPPSFIVETSTGKYHYYWLTHSTDLKLWQRIQKEVMSERLGSDPGANGLNRAMRIPGFWHSKRKPFPVRIIFLLGQDNIPIQATPDEEFLDFAKLNTYAKKEYAFDTVLAEQVKRYQWEEIVESFGRLLPVKAPEDLNYILSEFSPNEAMERIFAAEDYHGSLHALCMHFANYQQDAHYVSYIVQSLMCRVPEGQRDSRWNARFNDINRSASAAVTKKLHELAQETLVEHKDDSKHNKQEVSIHDENWPLAFPNISGACIPLDMLMEDFASNTNRPIAPFNFAAAFSFFTLCLQNIPIMPVMAERTANGCHLLLAPSTDGKDLSVSMPLKSLSKALKNGYLNETDFAAREVLQGLEPTGEITSLSAFQQWAESPWRVRGGIWINTECTSQIGKMSDENLNVANLAEVVVNIQDGTPIPTVTKATKKLVDQSTISRPLHEAYSLLFATQPASIKKFMTPGLLYKGVIGRFDYYVSDQPAIPVEDQPSTLSVDTLRKYTFRKEILEFLAWMLKQCALRRENCVDGYSRRVPIIYDETDPDPFEMESKALYVNGPRRQRHVNWDLECKRNTNWQVDDPQFKTFIDRIPMSTERWATVLATVQYLWECFQSKTIPFQEPIVLQDKILETVIKLGEYQYDVRFSRIWPLIGSTKGLDEKHKTVLETIQKADRNMNKWLKFVSQNLRHAHKVLFEKEFYIPTRAVARLLPYDVNIPTKDLLPIFNTLHSMGLIELVTTKQMDARILNKPLKNLVRLTAEGRI